MSLLRIAAVTGAAVAASAYAVRGRSSSVFGPSVYRGARDRRSLALTFDDGPSESTPALLDILAKNNLKATFFQCGVNAERLPGIAREVSAAGHEIGNHTHTHASLWLRAPAFVHAEVEQAQAVLTRIHPTPPKLFRAPFGVRWFGLREIQARLGLLGVMWTTVAFDWKLPAAEVFQLLRKSLMNGAILCLHDGREVLAKPDIGATLAAVRMLIPVILDEGYRLETVSEILCPTT